MLLLVLHTGFSGGRSDGLVFPLFKNFLQFVMIRTIKGFRVVNEAEVDVFLEFLCFFRDRTDAWQFDVWFLCLFLTPP